MNVTGKILHVLPLQTGMGAHREWRKQSYVLEYNQDSRFPKKMMFTLWGEKIEQANISEGQTLTVDFDIDCQEYNGRWYNEIRAWRVTSDAQPQGGPAPEPAAEDDFPF